MMPMVKRIRRFFGQLKQFYMFAAIILRFVWRHATNALRLMFNVIQIRLVDDRAKCTTTHPMARCFLFLRFRWSMRPNLCPGNFTVQHFIHAFTIRQLSVVFALSIQFQHVRKMHILSNQWQVASPDLFHKWHKIFSKCAQEIVEIVECNFVVFISIGWNW